MNFVYVSLVGLSSVLVSSLADAKPDAARYGWLSSYPAGLAEARRTGKPIFLVFRCEP